MKTLLAIILVLAITGCGKEWENSTFDPGYSYNKKNSTRPKIESKKDDSDDYYEQEEQQEEQSITVTRTRCVKTEYYTKYKYIVIDYPNGDKDLYCGIDWLGDRKLYLSSDHHYAPDGICIIERAWDRYWTFSVKDNKPQMKWFGTEDPEDAVLNSPLARQFEFDFCTVEEIEDENWFERYYYFGENLL